MELIIRQDPPQTGDRLMAEDSSLLEQAERGQIGPVLRFYEWIEPTISLGFHQSLDTLDHARLAEDKQAWTRRPTGGAAVMHSQELTYAIIMPYDETAAGAALIQELVSRSLVEGLRGVGVQAEMSARGEPLTALQNRASCFVRTSRWEVTVRGRKIVGSAQRKRDHAILQHGSILIGNDHLRITDYLKMESDEARQILKDRLDEKATCIENETQNSVNMDVLRECMAAGFMRIFSASNILKQSMVGAK
ncbi:MAG: lipoate--protein ligase family protein [Calditrichota bacterium]